jgi:CelD/BcsL family acetyltransferase involved in cellulose biosynthesis
LVTKRENSIFNSNSVSAKNAAKTHCKYGHPLSGDNLRTWTPRGKSNVRRKCRACENRASLARLSPEGGSAS